MKDAPAHHVRATVSKAYAAIVEKGGHSGCCSPKADNGACCAPSPTDAADVSKRLGYSDADLQAVPEGANLGVGCGNPQAIAALRRGEVVVDLGSGAGFDCFLASPQVGGEGRVIGVDMTPEMLKKARANAEKAGFSNVEFRLGEIENLPLADNSADVIMSNCVINLSPEKERVIAEAFRVLKPGGRLAISDVVQTAPMPEEVAHDPHLHSGCVSGAAPVADLTAWMQAVGFVDIRIAVKEESRAVIADWAPGTGVEAYVASANIEAVKPLD